MSKDPDGRVSYLTYRCYVCGRLVTKLEIIAAWDESDRTGKTRQLCACGSGRLAPTNPKWWEELFLPRVWYLWWHEVRNVKRPE
jgi:hypothetical protein